MDHKPLEAIREKPLAEAPPRIQRLLLKVQSYTFNLEYKPGKQLKIADALSRASSPIDPSDEDEWDTELQVQAIVASMPVPDARLNEFTAATEADPEMQTLSKVMAWEQMSAACNCLPILACI